LSSTVAPMMLELWEVVNELPNAVIHKEAKELRKQVRQLTRSLRGARMRIADLEYRSRFLTPVQHAHPILAEDGVTSPQDRQFEDSSNM
jgi:hypothetical protein